jgi:hypothetical protein
VAYGNASAVHRLNTNRSFTGSSNPTLTEVEGFLDFTAAEIDGILRARGFLVPVPTTATGALQLLAHGNALGAAMMVEQGAQTSDRREDARILWRDFKRMLESSDLGLESGTEDPDRGTPRWASNGSAMFSWPAVDTRGNAITDV